MKEKKKKPRVHDFDPQKSRQRTLLWGFLVMHLGNVGPGTCQLCLLGTHSVLNARPLVGSVVRFPVPFYWNLFQPQEAVWERIWGSVYLKPAPLRAKLQNQSAHWVLWGPWRPSAQRKSLISTEETCVPNLCSQVVGLSCWGMGLGYVGVNAE